MVSTSIPAMHSWGNLYTIAARRPWTLLVSPRRSGGAFIVGKIARVSSSFTRKHLGTLVVWCPLCVEDRYTLDNKKGGDDHLILGERARLSGDRWEYKIQRVTAVRDYAT